MKSFFVLFLFAFVCINPTYSQYSINAAGSDITSSTGSISQSVGIVSYTTLSNTDYSISQGVQHPFERMISSIGSEQVLDFNFSFYPNPVNEFLQYSIQSDNDIHYKYSIINMNGLLVASSELKDTRGKINFGELKSGFYLLLIEDIVSGTFQTLRIIKQ